jgi:hypothetical protein
MFVALVWMSASAQRLVGPFDSEDAVFKAFDTEDGIIRKGRFAGSRLFAKCVEPLDVLAVSKATLIA